MNLIGNHSGTKVASIVGDEIRLNLGGRYSVEGDAVIDVDGLIATTGKVVGTFDGVSFWTKDGTLEGVVEGVFAPRLRNPCLNG
jgi:hypothetical protein